MSQPRLPRFKRYKDIGPVRLTQRDQEILRYVHRHHFLRSDRIVALTGGSPQQVLRRLQVLYHHKYLDRPACQIDYYQSGSRRMAYGLGNRGAAWLKRLLLLRYDQQGWKQKNDVGRLFLEHALMVSDVMVAVELACRQRTDVRLLTVDDLDAPTRRRPFQWQVTLGRGMKYGVIPDGIFGLEFNGRKQWFLVEADRATMPVTRSSLKQSSVQRKLLAYEATWKQRIHQRQLNIERFRVLAVTVNAKRMEQMVAAGHQLKSGHGLFLFCDLHTLQQQFNFFSAFWRTCRTDTLVDLLS